MIAGQRKAHMFIWLVIALVIPLLLLFVLRELDFSKTASAGQQLSLQNNPSKALAKNNLVSVSLSDGTLQVVVTQPIRSTSALLFEMDSEGKRGREIGQLHGMGAYTFSVPPSLRGMYVIDSIKNQELFKLEW